MSAFINLWIYPTRACNLRCEYCYEEHDKSVMSLETAKLTVDWAFSQARLANAKGVGFYFFGGEPLVGKEALYKIVEYGKEIGKKEQIETNYRMNTNGTLIDDSVADFLIKNEVEIDLSLDGDKETNDKFRKTRDGQGTYDLVGGHSRIKDLLKRGLNISINMVVGPDNVRELSRNVELFWKYGIYSIQMLPLFDGGKKWTANDVSIFDSELERIKNSILFHIVETKDTKRLFFSPFSKVMDGILQEESKHLDKLKKDNYCGMGRSTFSVDVNGNIYSCPRLVHENRIDRNDESFIAGNVKGPVYNQSVVEKFRSWNPRTSEKSKCFQCKYVLCCPYQCLGHNLAVTGNEYDMSPIVCEIMEILYNHVKDIRDHIYPEGNEWFTKGRLNVGC